ncbi:MAG: glycosyltransferase [Anaerolineae bacterium]
MLLLNALKVIYIAAALLLGLYGLQALVLSVLYWYHRREKVSPPAVSSWPTVTVQIPLYNEMYVAERVLRAVTHLRYPRQNLHIQVLDDSTDETRHLLERAVARYREAGLDIDLIRRPDRRGFKAGALQYALPSAKGELIAIFDADFVPPADFLLRTVPYFFSDPRLGCVQTRWSHLNADYSSLTRAQAIGLDGHFVVEQAGRQRGGLFMAFNGTAGIWRRSCIVESGGWQADTLCEDLDLSYRAQIAGWHFLYLLEIAAPAEIPPQMAAFKRQQARWAHGSVQCLMKLWRPVLASRKPLPARLLGLVHLGAYLAHPMSLLLLWCLLPLLVWDGGIHLKLAFLNVVSFGPPLVYLIGQQQLYRDWPRRLVYFPVLFLLGAGLSWSNSMAIARALARRPMPFQRTPKFRLTSAGAGWERKRYALNWHWDNLGEIWMMAYAGTGIVIAAERGAFYIIPFLALYFLGFGYVAFYDIWRQWRAWRAQRRPASPRHLPV